MISQKHIFTILTCLMFVGRTNLVQIENHLDQISAYLHQPIIEGRKKLNPSSRCLLKFVWCSIFKQGLWVVKICLFSPNWKPLGWDISTTLPTNHRRRTKIESFLQIFTDLLTFKFPNKVCVKLSLFVHPPHWLSWRTFIMKFQDSPDFSTFFIINLCCFTWYSRCHSTSSPRSWTQPYHTHTLK